MLPQFLKMRKNKKTRLFLFLPIQTEDTLLLQPASRSRSARDQNICQKRNQEKYWFHLLPALHRYCCIIPASVPINSNFLPKLQQNIYENLTKTNRPLTQDDFYFSDVLIVIFFPLCPLLCWRRKLLLTKKSFPAINFVRQKIINFNN